MNQPTINPHPLTERQAEILDFIRGHIASYGRSPTMRELMRNFGWRSTNAAADAISYIAKKGYIVVDPLVSRGIRLVDKVEASILSVESDVDRIAVWMDKIAAAQSQNGEIILSQNTRRLANDVRRGMWR